MVGDFLWAKTAYKCFVFFYQRETNASAKGESPPQELEEGLRSCAIPPSLRQNQYLETSNKIFLTKKSLNAVQIHFLTTGQTIISYPTNRIWVKRTRMDIMQNSVTFCSTSELKNTHFKTGPNQSKNMQCTILSIRFIIW